MTNYETMADAASDCVLGPKKRKTWLTGRFPPVMSPVTLEDRKPLLCVRRAFGNSRIFGHIPRKQTCSGGWKNRRISFWFFPRTDATFAALFSAGTSLGFSLLGRHAPPLWIFSTNEGPLIYNGM